MQLRYKIATIAGLFAMGSLSGAQAAETQKKQAASPEPQGFVLIEEQVSIDTGRLPMMFLGDARTDFGNKNFGEAAADLRAASHVFEAEGKNSKNVVASGELKRAKDELDQLAQKTRSGQIENGTLFDQSLAPILYLKAEADRQRAISQWSRNEYKSVGYNLSLAADEIEQSAHWAGKNIDSTTDHTLRDVRRIGGKLAEGTDWNRNEVQTLIGNFKTASEKFGQGLENNKGTSSATSQSVK